jgi:hypothetical protein
MIVDFIIWELRLCGGLCGIRFRKRIVLRTLGDFSAENTENSQNAFFVTPWVWQIKKPLININSFLTQN